MKLIILNSLEPMKHVLFMTNFRLFINFRTFKPTLLIVITLLSISCSDNEFKTGYININIIRQEYTLSKYYKNRLEQLEEVSTQSLFDIQNKINTISKSIKQRNSKLEVEQEVLKSLYLLRTEFKDTQNKNIKMIEDSALHYREILNAEINKMVFSFGEKNNYKYVFNPAGSGNFMFADSSLDITKKVVIYLNSEKQK